MLNTDIQLLQIAVDALTPIIVLTGGLIINSKLKRMETAKEKVYQLKEMRKRIYDDLSDKLNIIYCYANDVGDFGEYTPQYIISLKRFVDRRFKTYESLWSKETQCLFNEFINACFGHFCGGLGKPALIKTTVDEKVAYAANTGKEWQDNWKDLFTNERDPEIGQKYSNMVTKFLQEFVD